jgi:hypothetical protein
MGKIRLLRPRHELPLAGYELHHPRQQGNDFRRLAMHLMPGYHNGQDLRKAPYNIFRLKL